MRPKSVEDGYVVRIVHKETTELTREWKHRGINSERKQHSVLWAVDFKETVACVPAEWVRNGFGAAKLILMNLLCLLMIQASCIFYLTLQLSLNHQLKHNKICKKWRQIPVSQSRNFNAVKEFLPSDRLSQISVLLLTICSGLQAFWSTLLTFCCITADQQCWNKWGYGSITWKTETNQTLAL